jgi:hypothetical protein
MNSKIVESFDTSKLTSSDIFPSVRKVTLPKPPCVGLYMLGPGSGTIRRYSPVGVGVALLE